VSSFDVLIFGSGCTFTLQGDGGFQNVSTNYMHPLRVVNQLETDEIYIVGIHFKVWLQGEW